jgi:hypothetical protein
VPDPQDAVFPEQPAVAQPQPFAPPQPYPASQSYPGAQPYPGPQPYPGAQPYPGSQPFPVDGQFLVPAPAPKKRTGLIVGISAGVVVVVGAAVALALVGGTSSSGTPSTAVEAAASSAAASPSPATSFTGAQASAVASLVAAAVGTSGAPATSGPGQVAAPASAGGLTEMTGTAAQTVTSAMKKADAVNPDFTAADFAAYAKTGSSSTYFANLTLVPLGTAPDVQQEYSAQGAAATLAAAGSGMTASDSENVSTMMPGGAMTCQSATVSSESLRECMWIDASEFGIFAAPASVSNAQASAYAEAIWSASESN